MFISHSKSSFLIKQLSEVAADLSEEHTTAHLAGERLEAEQAERMKLEKELDRLQVTRGTVNDCYWGAMELYSILFVTELTQVFQ